MNGQRQISARASARSATAIPASLMAFSTVWFTMPIASRCAESPFVRNAIRRRTRRRNATKVNIFECELVMLCQPSRRPASQQESARRVRHAVIRRSYGVISQTTP